MLLAPLGASAARHPPTPAALPSCVCAPSALSALQAEIGSVTSLAEAQRLALPPLRDARSALGRARWLFPGSPDLAEKWRQLRDGERAVAAGETPEAVADAFGVAVAGSPALASVDIDPPRCSYSTGEIIAIVLGFILGVIPGIILLIILC